MRVLVTGAAGFIGSHVAKALVHSGHMVLGLVLPGHDCERLEEVKGRIDLLEGDLRQMAKLGPALWEWKPEACIHLAWYAEPGKYLHSPENLLALQGSLDLLQKLYANECEYFIGAGTCAEYAPRPGPLSEVDPVKPETLYAATKLSFKLMSEQIALRHARQFAWARIFYLYGPHEDPRRLVPGAILKLAKGERFPASPGEQVRDFLHVRDVADAFVKLVEQRAIGTYNICSAQAVSLKMLLNTLGDLMGRPDLLSYGALPYRDWEPMYICGNNDRIRSAGWLPRFDLRSGLQDAIAWWGAGSQGR